MAIRVLLDHGVSQDHIIFVSFLVARTGGICVLQRAFPYVRFVCAAVDERIRESWLEGVGNEENEEDGRKDGRKVWVMEPGMGHIGESHNWKLPYMHD